MTDAIELIDALDKPNVRPFLWALRYGEGTQGEHGYRTMFGGGLFDSYADHPRQKITRNNLTSTAAGAYQFLARTWDGLVRQYGFANFEPKNQDLAAVALIKGRRALDDVIAGRFETAVMKCNKEWASLPGSPYGQPVVTMAKAKAQYEAAGGMYESAGIPQSVPPVEGYQESTTQEQPMAPFLLAALPALIDLVPKLGAMFADSETAKRNVQAATIVVEAAKQAIGARNEQELIESIQSDPNAAQAVKSAVEGAWFKLTEVGGGVESARAANEKSGANGSPAFWTQPAIWVTAMLMPLVYFVVYKVLTNSDFGTEVQSMVIASIVSGVLGAVTGFWLGAAFQSAKGAANK